NLSAERKACHTLRFDEGSAITAYEVKILAVVVEKRLLRVNTRVSDGCGFAGLERVKRDGPLAIDSIFCICEPGAIRRPRRLKRKCAIRMPRVVDATGGVFFEIKTPQREMRIREDQLLRIRRPHEFGIKRRLLFNRYAPNSAGRSSLQT